MTVRRERRGGFLGWRLGLCLLTLALAMPAGVGPAGSQDRLEGQLVVTITASGFSPLVLRINAAPTILVWRNEDSVAHTVTLALADGVCTATIPAGSEAHCSDPQCVGQYTYSVSGFAGVNGEIVVGPAPRNLTLSVSRLVIRKGQAVTLSGTLSYESYPPSFGGQPITVLRRNAGTRAFVPIAKVPSSRRNSTWRLLVRPRTTATYRAEDDFQRRPGCRTWSPARSRPATIVVRS